MILLLMGASLDVTGGYTVRAAGACTRVVEPGEPIGPLEPGDVVCLRPGGHGRLRVQDVHGTKADPIVVRGTGDGPATLTVGSLEHGAALLVSNSSYVQVLDLHLTHSQTGVEVRSSHDIRVEGLEIETVGQAAVTVGRSGWRGEFSGPASHHVDVISNRISDTGRVTARYGEGVYVGTGGWEGDDTHHVFVAYNTFADVPAEAIDLKPHTHDLVVRGNVVDSGSHFFHAAITVGAQAFNGPDMDALVENNLVRGFTGADVAGIGVGHGNTVVRDNVVGDVEGGCSLRTWTTFANPDARSVRFEGNDIAGVICLHDGDQGSGMLDGLGRVTVDGRQAW